MARRKNESNMFLSSQESANISGNEKPDIQNIPAPAPKAKEEKPVKAPSKAEKSPQESVKSKKSPASAATGESASSISSVLNLLANTKETRQNGVPKSVYLDKDIYDRITELSSQSGVPFSKILNMLLKAAFKDSEN